MFIDYKNIYKQFIKELNTILCSTRTCWVVSQEEERFLRLFRKIAQYHAEEGDEISKTFEVLSWSITEGLLNLNSFLINEFGVFTAPKKVVIQILKRKKNTLK